MKDAEGGERGRRKDGRDLIGGIKRERLMAGEVEERKECGREGEKERGKEGKWKAKNRTKDWKEGVKERARKEWER